ncbi:MAG TPA: DUF1150 family protein [Aliiroseovarius sp.]|nr:DUF1150 family protein [Aliiroseovarius sp.]
MNVKQDPFAEGSERIVYVRPVRAEDLPEEVRAQVGKAENLYAVHDKDGVQLALVNGRHMAFALARSHDYAPVNVH